MNRLIALSLMASLVLASAVPASAQGKRGPTSAPAAKTEDVAKKKADEEAYQRALKIIPEPKGKIDPWSGAR